MGSGFDPRPWCCSSWSLNPNQGTTQWQSASFVNVIRRHLRWRSTEGYFGFTGTDIGKSSSRWDDSNSQPRRPATPSGHLYKIGETMHTGELVGEFPKPRITRDPTGRWWWIRLGNNWEITDTWRDAVRLAIVWTQVREGNTPEHPRI